MQLRSGIVRGRYGTGFVEVVVHDCRSSPVALAGLLCRNRGVRVRDPFGYRRSRRWWITSPGLLTRFIRSDSLYAVHDLDGHRLHEVGEMLVEGGARVGDARREVHRHIGDFTLFWTGIYPEALRGEKTKVGHDRFIDYCTQGKRAYHIASTIQAEKEDVGGEVLERLSREFELCAFGLNEARKEWERRDQGGSWQLVVFN